MKLGMPTHPRRDLVEEIRRAARHGFDFVDLFLEPDKAEPGSFDPAAVRRALDGTGLAAVGHTAWYLPIGSEHALFRRVAIDGFRRYLDAFAAMNVSPVTIHANWPTPLFTDAEGLAWQIETLRVLVADAAERNLTVMYESGDGKRDTCEHIAAVLEALPELRFHADVGHLNLHGRKPWEAIGRFRDRLAHVHLHDNDGEGDRHWPLGKGRIDVRAVVAALKPFYDGTITLEVFDEDFGALLRSRDLVQRLWNEG